MKRQINTTQMKEQTKNKEVKKKERERERKQANYLKKNSE